MCRRRTTLSPSSLSTGSQLHGQQTRSPWLYKIRLILDSHSVQLEVKEVVSDQPNQFSFKGDSSDLRPDFSKVSTPSINLHMSNKTF